jgi:hypothetical protein
MWRVSSCHRETKIPWPSPSGPPLSETPPSSTLSQQTPGCPAAELLAPSAVVAQLESAKKSGREPAKHSLEGHATKHGPMPEGVKKRNQHELESAARPCGH